MVPNVGTGPLVTTLLHQLFAAAHTTLFLEVSARTKQVGQFRDSHANGSPVMTVTREVRGGGEGHVGCLNGVHPSKTSVKVM
jgi:hypothetical protein